MLSYGGEIGGVVFGGHGYEAVPEAGEGGVAVEDGTALGVDVEDVEGVGAGGELGFDAVGPARIERDAGELEPSRGGSVSERACGSKWLGLH